MLEVHESAKERMEEARAYARANGIEEQLEGRLEYLRTYGGTFEEGPNAGKDAFKVVLSMDFAPLSFGVAWYRLQLDGTYDEQPFLVGGMIFEGPQQPGDGSGPAFSVNLNSVINGESFHGWRVCT